MADDVTVDNAALTDYTVATDDVGGKHYQRFKLDVGGDGVSTPVVGYLPIGGNVAHDAVDSGNPIKFGGKAGDGNTPPTAVATGDRVDAWFDGLGVQRVTLVASDDGSPMLVAGSGLIVEQGSTPWFISVLGNVAHDAVDSGGPVKIGGKANDSAPTQVSNADRVDAWLDRRGALFTRLTDSAGAAIATGVQYVEDAALGTAAQGTLVLARRDDALSALTPVEGDAVGLRADARGALWTTLINGGDGSVAWSANGLKVDITGGVAIPVTPSGNVAHDAVDSGNPIKFGGKASTSFPTAVASGDRVDAHFDAHGHLGVWSVPHEMGGLTLTAKTAQYTAAQTGTALWTPAAGKRVVVTYFQIQSGGTTAGTCMLWFGAAADTTYSRGTDLAIFDGEWAPSATSKPGAIVSAGMVPVGLGASDNILRVTTTNAQTVTITVWGYEV